MHFPNTVSKNTFETYKICERFQIPEAKIKSYDFSIEIKKEIPKLKEICILFIKNNWKSKTQIYKKIDFKPIFFQIIHFLKKLEY